MSSTYPQVLCGAKGVKTTLYKGTLENWTAFVSVWWAVFWAVGTTACWVCGTLVLSRDYSENWERNSWRKRVSPCFVTTTFVPSLYSMLPLFFFFVLFLTIFCVF